MEKEFSYEPFLDQAQNQVEKLKQEAKEKLESAKNEVNNATLNLQDNQRKLDELKKNQANKKDIHFAGRNVKDAKSDLRRANNAVKNLKNLLALYEKETYCQKKAIALAKELKLKEKDKEELKARSKEIQILKKEAEEAQNISLNKQKNAEDAAIKLEEITFSGGTQEQLKDASKKEKQARKEAEKAKKIALNASVKYQDANRAKKHPWHSLWKSITNQFHRGDDGVISVFPSIARGGRYLYREGTAYIILLVLVIIFGIMNPSFLSGRSIRSLFTGTTISTMIVGMGIIFVMLTGGIDLSVGWIVATCGIFTGYMIYYSQIPLFVIIILSIILGFFMGLLNGLIASKLKLFPLIITLATASIFEGISYLIKGNNNFTDLANVRQGMESISAIATTQFLGMPINFWIAIILIFITWFVLNKTRFGRDVLAVGGNKECARLSGINVDLVTCLCYGLCGFFASIASFDIVAQNGSATTEALNAGLEFTCLTAAIVGGISMMGGKGNVLGMVVGIMIMQVIAVGMQFAGLNSNAQKIIKGAILLLAVSFDVIKNWPKAKMRLKKLSNKSNC